METGTRRHYRRLFDKITKKWEKERTSLASIRIINLWCIVQRLKIKRQEEHLRSPKFIHNQANVNRVSMFTLYCTLTRKQFSRSIGVGTPPLSKLWHNIDKAPVVLHPTLGTTSPLFLLLLLVNLMSEKYNPYMNAGMAPISNSRLWKLWGVWVWYQSHKCLWDCLEQHGCKIPNLLVY